MPLYKNVEAPKFSNGWLEGVFAPKIEPRQRNKDLEEVELIYGEMMGRMQGHIDILADDERIQEAIIIGRFIEGPNKVVKNRGEDLINTIAGRYGEERVEETDEEVEKAPPITIHKALYALLVVQKYEEQQKFGDRKVLKHLNNYGMSLRRQVANADQYQDLEVASKAGAGNRRIAATVYATTLPQGSPTGSVGDATTKLPPPRDAEGTDMHKLQAM
ncbi:hypothetical protein MMC11_002145 [Xylographa trunciseda]|nr:hypothetical protein [Xylographa trunciseda]